MGQWHWLRDPNYPDVQDQEVLEYLNQENAYFEAAMAPHKALTDELFIVTECPVKHAPHPRPRQIFLVRGRVGTTRHDAGISAILRTAGRPVGEPTRCPERR